MSNCPFCGSKEIRVETPFVKSVGAEGEFEPEKSWCCNAQKTNQEYISKNFHPDDAPNSDDVSKL